LSIRIFYDSTKYRFPGWRKAGTMLERVIRNENKVLGDLSFIITSDEILRKINKEFLNHDYYTDVIAFDNSKENIINGEIYISKETVKINALNYNVSLKKEMLRVMIHGVLHLAGYSDKSTKERKVMTILENRWLAEMKGEQDGIQV
jgi:probable rRNA maturation factor